MHRWWVLLHIAGAFGFLMAHGVSAYAVLRLRKERDPVRVSQLLEMSSGSIGVMWNAIGLLLIGGVVAGFTGHFWGQGWIWAAIVLLLAITVAMYAVATPWVKRLRTVAGAMAEGSRAVSQEQFEDILRSKRPHSIAAIGFVGLARDPLPDDLQADARVRRRSGVSGRRRRGDGMRVRRPDASSPTASPRRADEPFDLVFTNDDDGVQHNVAIYRDDIRRGVAVRRRPDHGARRSRTRCRRSNPATYFFRCDVHPQMNGTLEAG